MPVTKLQSIKIRQSVPIPIGADGIMAEFTSFDGFAADQEHFAVLLGPQDVATPLVRIHSQCVTGDIFGSQLCDCGTQLHEAITRCAAEGGMIIYLRQEGRGIGFNAKLDAYHLQANGANTYEANELSGHPADARDYSAALGILRALEISRCRLLTNNPAKVAALRNSDVDLIETVPTAVHLTPHNAKYLRDKAELANHTMEVPDAE